jgi:tetratricopeptide (TPR) repeat protein
LIPKFLTEKVSLQNQSLFSLHPAGGCNAHERKVVSLVVDNLLATVQPGFTRIQQDALGRCIIKVLRLTFRPAASLGTKSPNTIPKNAKLLTNLGAAETEASNFTGALIYFMKALSADPHHVGALVGIDSVLERLGNLSAAMICSKEAIAQPATDKTGLPE